MNEPTFSLHVTINYPNSEKEYEAAPRYTRAALRVEISNIIHDTPEATSFVFVVSKHHD